MPDQPEGERRTFRRRLLEAFAGDTLRIEPTERVEILEASDADRRALRKELDLIAYSALDYVGGNEQDIKAVERRKLVQQARVAWREDPQLGAATELMNDFTLGRGVPKPQASDQRVQDIIDEAWEDEDNQRVLTGYSAQMQLGTDLSLQSNLFILVFDEGDDGKIKLGVLAHDSVENVVRDPDNRLKVLFYVAREKRVIWDFDEDQPKVDTQAIAGKDRLTYYKHWLNEPEKGFGPKKKKIGDGKVYHVAVNKGHEAAFGHPTMHRVLRWATAFNEMMTSRTDLVKAAAAFIMKRKVKGTPNQVQKAAEKALSRRSELARYVGDDDEDYEVAGPRAGSIITENEGVSHEAFKLDSNAANANVDGQMIRSQISAATHFPQHYLGDIGSANLATASSMELPVLKAVESRQEVIEQIFRWFVDQVIHRAIEAGKLDEDLSDAEMAEKADEEQAEQPPEAGAPAPQPSPEANGNPLAGSPTEAMLAKLREAVEAGDIAGAQELLEANDEDRLDLGVTEEDEAEGEAEEDDEDRKRDLSYDFNLPSPLRRTLNDLVNAVATTARTFDPNGTNVELSRVLLGVALGEGLELSDPGDVVDKVYPPGYVDPAMAALQQAQQGGGGGPPDFGNTPPQGVEFGSPNGSGEENPYGAPQQASTPEENPYGPTGAAGGPLAEAQTPEAQAKPRKRGERAGTREEAAAAFDRDVAEPIRQAAKGQHG